LGRLNCWLDKDESGGYDALDGREGPDDSEENDRLDYPTGTDRLDDPVNV